MLVYILIVIVFAVCILTDYLINKNRQEENNQVYIFPRMIIPPFEQNWSGIIASNIGKPCRNHRWTAEEKQFLINNFKEISVPKMVNCKEMGGRHSKNAIYKMAKRLGLSASNPFCDKKHNDLLTEKLRTESNQE